MAPAAVLARDRFSPELARTLALALTGYGPTLRLALSYAEDGRPASLELLHGAARSIGLELLVFLRTSELIDEFPAGHQPEAVLPLARLLGESFSILLAVPDQETMSRLPMASLDVVDARYDDAAREWMGRFIDDLPHRVEECTDAD